MRLSELPADICDVPAGMDAVEITGVSADSRTIAEGDLFVAIPGTKADGGRFIADAAGRGAVAVLAAQGAVVPEGLAVPVLRAAEPRRARAPLGWR
jgi:UDP-N-acetylmuramoyl-L-alanyl-D-glutamate--2,6-diaminopimelate ligase